jgi:1-phosphofructokinase
VNHAVVTLTLNPAIDLTVEVSGFVAGNVHRAKAATANAGGKGVNVAGCLADWGCPVIATGAIGRGNAEVFTQFFATKGIEDRFVRVAGDTRTNIKIADSATGETTDINLPGLVLDERSLVDIQAALVDHVVAGSVVVMAGSLPAGVPDDIYPRLAAPLRTLGARVVLDTSGAPLDAALAAAADALPHVVKPNRHELEAWAGRPLETIAELIAAARQLIGRGLELVVISMGADGALFVRANEALHAKLPPVKAISTVGAGDSMVAGIVSALADDLELAALARRAVAFAAAKLEQIGPHLPSLAIVRQREAEATIVPVA